MSNRVFFTAPFPIAFPSLGYPKMSDTYDKERANRCGVSMEKIIIRTLIVAAAGAVILALTYYPPNYALPPFVFMIMCIGAEFVLPKNPKNEVKGLSKTLSKVLTWLLGIGALACVVVVGLLWKAGYFWRLK